jgi:hypothetical protein
MPNIKSNEISSVLNANFITDNEQTVMSNPALFMMVMMRKVGVWMYMLLIWSSLGCKWSCASSVLHPVMFLVCVIPYNWIPFLPQLQVMLLIREKSSWSHIPHYLLLRRPIITVAQKQYLYKFCNEILDMKVGKGIQYGVKQCRFVVRCLSSLMEVLMLLCYI